MVKKSTQTTAQTINLPANGPVIQPIGQPNVMPAGKAQPIEEKGKSSEPMSKSLCESYMYRYVEVEGADGQRYDGIVEQVDDEWLCLAVPGSVEPTRGFYPSPGYPHYPHYPYAPYGGYYPYRPRRFNRLVLPLVGLTAISLLPFYW
jgi:hypothetical protein